MELGAIGLQLHSHIEQPCCFWRAIVSRQNKPKIVKRIRLARIQLERLRKLIDRLLPLARAGECDAEVCAGGGVGGPYSYSMLEWLNRLGKPIKLDECNAEIIVRA